MLSRVSWWALWHFFSFSSFQQQHIIFSPVEVWRETKVGFGITAIRSRDSSSLLEAAEVRAAWQREIGRTDKSQRSRILTKIHQNNVELYQTKRGAHWSLWNGWDSKTNWGWFCCMQMGPQLLSTHDFWGGITTTFIEKKTPLCRALTTTTTLQFKIGEEGESFLMKGRTQKIRQM